MALDDWGLLVQDPRYQNADATTQGDVRTAFLDAEFDALINQSQRWPELEPMQQINVASNFAIKAGRRTSDDTDWLMSYQDHLVNRTWGYDDELDDTRITFKEEWSRFKQNWIQAVPFLGGWKDAKESIGLYQASKRIQNGEADDRDWEIWKEAHNEQMELERRGRTLGGKFMAMAGHLPAFGLEIAITGGVTKGLSLGVKKGLTAGAARMVGKSADDLAYLATHGHMLSPARLAVGGAQQAGWLTAQMVGQTAALRPISTTLRNMTPGQDLSWSEQQAMWDLITFNEGEELLPAAAAGFLDTGIELYSETLGGAIAAPGKWAAAGIRKATPDAIKQALGARLGLAKRAVEKLGLNRVSDLAKAAKFHGILPEMGEEIAGDVLRGATGLQGEGPFLERVSQAFPDLTTQEGREDLTAQALSFAAYGGLLGTAGAIIERGESRLNERVKGALKQEREEGFRKWINLAKQNAADQRRVYKDWTEAKPEDLRTMAKNAGYPQWRGIDVENLTDEQAEDMRETIRHGALDIATLWNEDNLNEMNRLFHAIEGNEQYADLLERYERDDTWKIILAPRESWNNPVTRKLNMLIGAATHYDSMADFQRSTDHIAGAEADMPQDIQRFVELFEQSDGLFSVDQVLVGPRAIITDTVSNITGGGPYSGASIRNTAALQPHERGYRENERRVRVTIHGTSSPLGGTGGGSVAVLGRPTLRVLLEEVAEVAYQRITDTNDFPELQRLTNEWLDRVNADLIDQGASVADLAHQNREKFSKAFVYNALRHARVTKSALDQRFAENIQMPQELLDALMQEMRAGAPREMHDRIPNLEALGAEIMLNRMSFPKEVDRLTRRVQEIGQPLESLGQELDEYSQAAEDAEAAAVGAPERRARLRAVAGQVEKNFQDGSTYGYELSGLTKRVQEVAKALQKPRANLASNAQALQKIIEDARTRYDQQGGRVLGELKGRLARSKSRAIGEREADTAYVTGDLEPRGPEAQINRMVEQYPITVRPLVRSVLDQSPDARISAVITTGPGGAGRPTGIRYRLQGDGNDRTLTLAELPAGRFRSEATAEAAMVDVIREALEAQLPGLPYHYQSRRAILRHLDAYMLTIPQGYLDAIQAAYHANNRAEFGRLIRLGMDHALAMHEWRRQDPYRFDKDPAGWVRSQIYPPSPPSPQAQAAAAGPQGGGGGGAAPTTPPPPTPQAPGPASPPPGFQPQGVPLSSVGVPPPPTGQTTDFIAELGLTEAQEAAAIQALQTAANPANQGLTVTHAFEVELKKAQPVPPEILFQDFAGAMTSVSNADIQAAGGPVAWLEQEYGWSDPSSFNEARARIRRSTEWEGGALESLIRQAQREGFEVIGYRWGQLLQEKGIFVRGATSELEWVSVGNNMDLLPATGYSLEVHGQQVESATGWSSQRVGDNEFSIVMDQAGDQPALELSVTVPKNQRRAARHFDDAINRIKQTIIAVRLGRYRGEDPIEDNNALRPPALMRIPVFEDQVGSYLEEYGKELALHAIEQMRAARDGKAAEWHQVALLQHYTGLYERANDPSATPEDREAARREMLSPRMAPARARLRAEAQALADRMQRRRESEQEFRTKNNTDRWEYGWVDPDIAYQDNEGVYHYLPELSTSRQEQLGMNLNRAQVVPTAIGRKDPKAVDVAPGVGVQHFGNPFSSTSRKRNKSASVYGFKNIQEANQAYAQWLSADPGQFNMASGRTIDLAEIEPKRRKWIRQQLADQALMGKAIYSSQNRGTSHADVLADLQNQVALPLVVLSSRHEAGIHAVDQSTQNNPDRKAVDLEYLGYLNIGEVAPLVGVTNPTNWNETVRQRMGLPEGREKSRDLLGRWLSGKAKRHVYIVRRVLGPATDTYRPEATRFGTDVDSFTDERRPRGYMRHHTPEAYAWFRAAFDRIKETAKEDPTWRAVPWNLQPDPVAPHLRVYRTGKKLDEKDPESPYADVQLVHNTARGHWTLYIAGQAFPLLTANQRALQDEINTLRQRAAELDPEKFWEQREQLFALLDRLERYRAQEYKRRAFSVDGAKRRASTVLLDSAGDGAPPLYQSTYEKLTKAPVKDNTVQSVIAAWRLVSHDMSAEIEVPFGHLTDRQLDNAWVDDYGRSDTEHWQEMYLHGRPVPMSYFVEERVADPKNLARYNQLRKEGKDLWKQSGRVSTKDGSDAPEAKRLRDQAKEKFAEATKLRGAYRTYVVSFGRRIQTSRRNAGDLLRSMIQYQYTDLSEIIAMEQFKEQLQEAQEPREGEGDVVQAGPTVESMEQPTGRQIRDQYGNIIGTRGSQPPPDEWDEWQDLVEMRTEQIAQTEEDEAFREAQEQDTGNEDLDQAISTRRQRLRQRGTQRTILAADEWLGGEDVGLGVAGRIRFEEPTQAPNAGVVVEIGDGQNMALDPYQPAPEPMVVGEQLFANTMELAEALAEDPRYQGPGSRQRAMRRALMIRYDQDPDFRAALDATAGAEYRVTPEYDQWGYGRSLVHIVPSHIRRMTLTQRMETSIRDLPWYSDPGGRTIGQTNGTMDAAAIMGTSRKAPALDANLETLFDDVVHQSQIAAEQWGQHYRGDSDLLLEIKARKDEAAMAALEATEQSDSFRIEAPHFVAAAEIQDGVVVRTAPILDYMMGWTTEQVRDYVESKKWQMESEQERAIALAQATQYYNEAAIAARWQQSHPWAPLKWTSLDPNAEHYSSADGWWQQNVENIRAAVDQVDRVERNLDRELAIRANTETADATIILADPIYDAHQDSAFNYAAAEPPAIGGSYERPAWGRNEKPMETPITQGYRPVVVAKGETAQEMALEILEFLDGKKSSNQAQGYERGLDYKLSLTDQVKRLEAMDEMVKRWISGVHYRSLNVVPHAVGDVITARDVELYTSAVQQVLDIVMGRNPDLTVDRWAQWMARTREMATEVSDRNEAALAAQEKKLAEDYNSHGGYIQLGTEASTFVGPPVPSGPARNAFRKTMRGWFNDHPEFQRYWGKQVPTDDELELWGSLLRRARRWHGQREYKNNIDAIMQQMATLAAGAPGNHRGYSLEIHNYDAEQSEFAGRAVSNAMNDIEDIRHGTRVITRRMHLELFKVQRLAARMKRKWSPHIREVMTHYLEGTDYADVEHQRLRDLLEEAGALEDAIEIRKIYNRMRDSLNETLARLNEKEYIRFLEGFMPHLYTSKSVRLAYGGALEQMAHRHSKKREIPNYREALELGLEPQTLDVSELLLKYTESTWRWATRRSVVDIMLRSTMGDGRTRAAYSAGEWQGGALPVAAGAPAGLIPRLLSRVRTAEDAVTLNAHEARPYRRVSTSFAEGGEMYVHPDVYGIAEKLIEIEKPNAFWNGLATFNAWAKKVQLSLSMFHHWALLESAVAFNGLQAFQRMGKDVPAEFTEGSKRPRGFDVGIWLMEQDAILEDMIAHGMTFGAPSTIMRNTVNDGLRNIAKAFNNVPLLGAGAQALTAGNEKWDAFLWDRMFNGYKALAYVTLVEKYLGTGQFDGREDQLKDAVASVVNAGMGGINWNEQFWATPMVQKVLRGLLLAPDWTTANIQITPFPRLLKLDSALTKAMGHIRTEAEAERAMIAQQIKLKSYWPKMVLSLGLAPVIFQGAIYAMFRGDDDEYQPFHLMNEYGHNSWLFTDIDVTPIIRSLDKLMGPVASVPILGMVAAPFYHETDKAENAMQRYFIHGGKQVREIWEGWFKNPFGTLARKMSPFMQAAMESYVEISDSGDQYRYPGFNIRHYSAPPRAFITKFIPFSVRGNQFAFTLPLGKGMTEYKAEKHMEGALFAYADPSLLNGWGKPSYIEELNELLPEVVTAAEKNGVDIDQAFSDAKGNVRSVYYGRFLRAYESGDRLEQESATKALLRLQAGIKELDSSMSKRSETWGAADYDNAAEMMRRVADRMGLPNSHALYRQLMREEAKKQRERARLR